MSLIYENKEQLVEPYSKLAYIYDDVMAHVDYKNWARYIMKIIEKWHPATHKVVDISCGTASLLLKLDSTKYQRYGCDFSFDMLKIARSKCEAMKEPISLWQGNMISFWLNQKVDIVISLYDSVNYLLNVVAWKKMLTCVYNALYNDGLFIFDICTEKNSRKYFDNYSEKKKADGFFYTRESKYNAIDKIHSNRFVIHFDKEQKTFVEFHEQKIMQVKEVLELVEQTNFQLLGAFHGFTFKPGTENSLRIHFVLKKKIANDSTI